MKDLLKRLTDKTAKSRFRLSRDELFTIFDYCVGGMSSTPARFTQYLKHVGIITMQMRFADARRPGVEIESTILDEQAQALLDEYFPNKRTQAQAQIENLDKARNKRKLEATAEKAIAKQAQRNEA
jgi:hypothetical protein